MKKTVHTFVLTTVLVMSVTGAAFAQSVTTTMVPATTPTAMPDPGHSRINEVQQRIEN